MAEVWIGSRFHAQLRCDRIVAKLPDQTREFLKKPFTIERGLFCVRFVACLANSVAPLGPKSTAPIGLSNSGLCQKPLLTQRQAAVGFGGTLDFFSM